MQNIEIIGPEFNQGEKCEKILRLLPDWFGIESAIQNYRKGIDKLPTFLIYFENEFCGFVSVKQHFKESAELYVLGIKSENHRHGIGRFAIKRVCAYLRQLNVKFLQVKTLSKSRESEAYRKTRKFYLKMGFTPLEEFKELWGKDNPCLLMVKEI